MSFLPVNKPKPSEPTLRELVQLNRRDFLTSTASGIGGLALASILGADGLLAQAAPGVTDPLTPKLPHFPAKVRQCIFIYMEGGVSQLDLFDPKRKLAELNGQKIPESLTKNVRFAFLQKDSAVF